MNRFLVRVRAGLLPVGLVLLATACETISPNRAEVSEGGVRNWIFNGDLDDKIAVQNFAIGDDSAVLRVSCDVVGLEDEQMTIYWQVDWIDYNGLVIRSTPKQPMFFRGMEVNQAAATAPDARAVKARFQFFDDLQPR